VETGNPVSSTVGTTGASARPAAGPKTAIMPLTLAVRALWQRIGRDIYIKAIWPAEPDLHCLGSSDRAVHQAALRTNHSRRASRAYEIRRFFAACPAEVESEDAERPQRVLGR